MHVFIGCIIYHIVMTIICTWFLNYKDDAIRALRLRRHRDAIKYSLLLRRFNDTAFHTSLMCSAFRLCHPFNALYGMPLRGWRQFFFSLSALDMIYAYFLIYPANLNFSNYSEWKLRVTSWLSIILTLCYLRHKPLNFKWVYIVNFSFTETGKIHVIYFLLSNW